MKLEKTENHINGFFIKKQRHAKTPDQEIDTSVILYTPHDSPPQNHQYRLNDSEILTSCQKKDPSITTEDLRTYQHLENDVAAFEITEEISKQISTLLTTTEIPFEVTLISESGLHRGFVDINRRPTNRNLIHEITKDHTTEAMIEMKKALIELCREDPFNQEGPVRNIFDHEKDPNLKKKLETEHLNSIATIWDIITSTKAQSTIYIEGHSMWPYSPNAEAVSGSKSLDEGKHGVRGYNRNVIEAMKTGIRRPDLDVLSHKRTSRKELIPFSSTPLSEAIIQAYNKTGIDAQLNKPYAGSDALMSVVFAERFSEPPNYSLILDYNKSYLNNGEITAMTPKSQEELALIAAPVATTIVSNIIREFKKR